MRGFFYFPTMKKCTYTSALLRDRSWLVTPLCLPPHRTSKSLILLEMVGLLKFLANHREDEENEGSSAVGTPNESAMTKTSVGGGIAKSSSMLAILLSPFRAISFIDDSVPVSPAVQLVMSCLDRAGAVDASDISRWKPTQLLTPRDLETGAMPLRDGVEFGEILPIRINE